MDKILRIYEGESGGYVGGGAKLYSIRNDMHNYTYVDENTYKLDKFEATLDYTRGYDIDIFDVWRLYDIDGTLLGSGRVMVVPEINTGTESIITGEGWIGIFKDRKITRTQPNGDTGKDVLLDILTNEYSAYTFDTTGVDTPANAFNNLSFDGLYAYDIIKFICDNSYGANNRNFNIRVYESPIALGTIKIDFFESETAAVLANITSHHVKPSGFQLRNRGDLNSNYIYVYGAKDIVNMCPADGDWWTEKTTNALVQAIWKPTYAVAESDIGGLPGSVGTYDVQINCNNAITEATATLDLTDSDAYNAGYTPDDFTSGQGYHIHNDREQWLDFGLVCDSVVGTDILAGGYIMLSFFVGTGSTTLEEEFVCELWGASSYDSALNSKYKRFKFNIKDTIPDSTYDRVNALVFSYVPNAAVTNADFYIDGLHFYTVNKQILGEYNASVTPRVDHIINDKNILSDTLATNIASYYYKSQRQQYCGTLELSKSLTELYAGGSVSINYPLYGVDLSKVPINSVVWTPYSQVINLGRVKTNEELMMEAKTQARMQK